MLAKKKTKEKDVIDLMLDQIDFHGMTAEELSGENGLLKQLTSRFYSRALEAEMDSHLGYKKNDNSGDNSGNSRNGYTSKTVILENNDTGMPGKKLHTDAVEEFAKRANLEIETEDF